MAEIVGIYQHAIKCMGESIIENLLGEHATDETTDRYLTLLTSIRKQKPWIQENLHLIAMFKNELQADKSIWQLHNEITVHWVCCFEPRPVNNTASLSLCISNALAMFTDDDPEAFYREYQYDTWLLALIIIVDNLTYFKSLIKQSNQMSPVSLTN